ncbi:extracellular membrane, cfem domain [Trichoderma arundinaceum]|uniref:Extracellular membrane, cfem domain n=1 Tax=Trichoderma arundinaceum TaxID=490622 RepID=A0A395NPT4_TRIAR|nr:extracellular membrane, cfem domain [Trichoderma arundinaceum]
MKFTVVLATFVAAAYGQTIGDIPPCAIPCIQNAIATETTCAANDFKCACQTDNFNAILAASTSCVIAACGADTAINKVLPAVQALCAAQ